MNDRKYHLVALNATDVWILKTHTIATVTKFNFFVTTDPAFPYVKLQNLSEIEIVVKNIYMTYIKRYRTSKLKYVTGLHQ